ncbi:MAG TPA: D-alanyl-D-alanine carboxypeptidase/D-alanyl-D-alanine-endopeptidase [Candidatus Baltobacteraceae bacterium]
MLTVAIVWIVHRRRHDVAPQPLAVPTATPATVIAPAAPAWSYAQRAALRRALHASLDRATAGAGAWSCVVLGRRGDVLFDDRAMRPAMPASSQKLIVASTALHDLGPAYRFHTLFAAGRKPVNGTLEGDLWVAGSGDPSLRSPDLRAGVSVLRRNGLHAIDGSIVVDGSAIAGEEINPLWNADDANEDFEVATSGISLDEDTVEFDVTGTTPGAPARIQTEPSGDAVQYSGSIATSASGDDVIIAATDAPNRFIASGVIPPGVTEKYWVPVHGIPQYVGSVLTRMFKLRGITVARPPATGIVPLRTVVLWDHRSAPLRDLVHDMLFASDNHYAEQLMRVAGGLDGAAATDAHGISAERSFLRGIGVPTPGIHVVDGSGLAHANRVAAITLAGILSYEQRVPGGNPLYLLLPRGGADGTLKHYRFTSALGRVRAKSGHLSDAEALAGYVTTRHHGRVSFAFIVNDSPGDPDDAIVSAVDKLSDF